MKNNTNEKTEEHTEFINGKVKIGEIDSVAHNSAVLEIASALKNYIAENGSKCKVFTENVALYCDELCNNKGNLFLPDVMCVRDKNGIRDDGVHTAPEFVVEVTSDATKKNDYCRKMVVYEEIGVREYWVVDLQRNLIVRYLADNDFVPEFVVYDECQDKCISVSTYPGLRIELSRIFAYHLSEDTLAGV